MISAMKKNNAKGNISLIICQQILIVLVFKYIQNLDTFATSTTWTKSPICVRQRIMQ